MNKKYLLIALLFFAGLAICPQGRAAIYQYTDKAGLVYFSDDLQSIPLEHRKTAKIVSGELKGEKQETPSLPQVVQPEGIKAETLPVAQRDAETTARKIPFGGGFVTSAIVVITACCLFIIFRILDADHRKSIAISRVVIAWGVVVYLLVAHTADVVSFFRSMGNSIENTQRQSEEKGKKAAQAIQKLDALLEKAAASSGEQDSTAEK